MMTTENIEEIAAHVSAKTGGRFLWYFGGLLLSIATLYFGLKSEIDTIASNQEIRRVEVNGRFDRINDNLDNLKDQISDLKKNVNTNDREARQRRK